VLRSVPIALFLLLAPASVAFAQVAGALAGTSIPEPTDGVLFAIGLAGLIIGRRVARRKD
jgi:hypothetical protein